MGFSFSTKLITILFLMISLLTQAFASSLSCAHHSTKNSDTSTVSSQIQHHAVEVQHSHHLHQITEHSNHSMMLHNPHNHDAAEVVESCHVAESQAVMQMAADECHCTSFITMELMSADSDTLISVMQPQSSILISSYKPEPGFLNTPLRPPATLN